MSEQAERQAQRLCVGLRKKDRHSARARDERIWAAPGAERTPRRSGGVTACDGAHRSVRMRVYMYVRWHRCRERKHQQLC